MIREERHRHTQNHPFTIHPFSIFSKYWQMFIGIIWFIMLLFDIYEIPFRHTIEHKPIQIYLWKKISLFINFICIIDIIVKLLTGFVSKQNDIELRLSKVFIHHLWPWVLVDLFTILYSSELTHNILNTILNSEYSNYADILRYVRILKIYDVENAISWLKDTYLISYFTYWAMQWCVRFFFLLHILTSMYCTIGAINFRHDLHKNLSWVQVYLDMYEGQDIPNSYIYMHGMMECLLKFNWNHQHFGIISPKYTSEQIFALVIVMMSASFQAVFIVSFFMLNKNVVHLEHEEKFKNFLRIINCPTKITKNILWRYKKEQRDGLCNVLFNDISRPLKLNIIEEIIGRDLRFSELFIEVDQIIFEQICSEILYDIFRPNNVIFRSNDKVDFIYYLCSGEVAVYDSSGTELYHLFEDSYFGLIDPDIKGPFRIFTLISVESSEVLKFPLKTIHEYCKKSEIFEKTLKLMKNRKRFNKESLISRKNYIDNSFM